MGLLSFVTLIEQGAAEDTTSIIRGRAGCSLISLGARLMLLLLQRPVDLTSTATAQPTALLLILVITR